MRFSGFSASLGSGLLLLTLAGNLSAQSDMPDRVKMLRESAVKYQAENKLQLAEVAYREILADYSQTSYALESQGEIVRLKIRGGDKVAAASEYQKLLVDYKDNSGALAKEILSIAQEYKKASDGKQALALHRYNVENHSDCFEGQVSQLEIIYDAFDRKDFSAADKETKFFTDNFGKNQGMAYGMYVTGNRYRDAGLMDKALDIYKLSVANAQDLGSMLSLSEIINEYLNRKDFNQASAQAKILLEQYKQVSGISREIYRLGSKYDSLGMYDKAIECHRYNVANTPANSDSLMSQSEIVRYAFKSNYLANADKEIAFMLERFKDDAGLPQAIYQIGCGYKTAGKPDKALEYHHINVKNSRDTKPAMLSQVEIALDKFEKKDYQAVEVEMTLLKDVFAEVPGISKELYQLALRLKKDGRADDALKYHKHNVENYFDTYEGSLSQLEVIFAAFERKEYEIADVEVDFLLDKFTKDTGGLAFGVFEIGKKYKAAGFPEKKARMYQAVINNSVGLAAMFAQVETINDYLDEGNFEKAASESEVLCEKYKAVDGISRELYLLGRKYSSLEKYAEAIKYHQLNVERYPKTADSALSQAEIVICGMASGVAKNNASDIDSLINNYCGKRPICDEIVQAVENNQKAGRQVNKDEILDKLSVALDNTIKDSDLNKQLVSMVDKVAVLAAQGKTSEVNELVNSIIQGNADKYKGQTQYAGLINGIGQICFKQKQYSEAAKIYRKSLEVDITGDDRLNAYGGLARAMVHLENDPAQNEAMIAGQMTCDSIIALIAKDYSDTTSLDIHLFEIGEQYFELVYPPRMPKHSASDAEKETLKKALALWQKVIDREDKANVYWLKHAYYYKGVINYYLGDLLAAVENLQVVLERWPDYEYGWSAQSLIGDYAEILGQNGMMAKEQASILVEASYLAVLKNHPGSPLENHAYKSLGKFYYENQQWDKAIDNYSKLIEKDDSYLEPLTEQIYQAYNNLGLTETAEEFKRVVGGRAKQE